MEKEYKRKENEIKNEASITFYAAECMEFVVLGKVYEGLNLEEAVEIYKRLSKDTRSMGNGIGFIIHDKNDRLYDESEFGLLSGGMIDVDLINDIPYFRESPLVQNAISEIKQLLPDVEVLETTTPMKPKKKEAR